MTRQVLCFALFGFLLVGCEAPPPPVPAPRPVAVLTLEETDPGRLDRVTGTVSSWKTDQLGFEVEGRVEFVIEPETNIKGAVSDKDGNVITGGTLLARIDPTRYALAVENAKAQVDVAERQRESAVIEYEQVIPAETQAAQAQRDLAKIEFERQTQLLARNAAARRDLDFAESMLQQREAKLIELAALKQAKAAEVASVTARIRELQETQRKAERDLADCELRSSFAGQVADIHVIPGSVIRRGEPVVTVQMMDPIKVEIEVSAATARRLNHRDQVRIHIPQSTGEPQQRLAFIYMIDPVADPNTRTFTVTMMFRNERIRAAVPDGVDRADVARAGLIGKVFAGLAEKPDVLFVNEEMVQQDEDGFFIWKILNRRIGTLVDDSQSHLDVEKVRVEPGELQVPFIGLFTLREITIEENAAFDTDLDMVAGEVTLPDGQPTWDGNQLLYDRVRWLVRPGDLVGVDQRAVTIPPGIYVPLDSIVERSGAQFVFALVESPEGDRVRRVEITVHENAGTLRRIEATDGESLGVRQRIVARGAAFLSDGESVNVAREIVPQR